MFKITATVKNFELTGEFNISRYTRNEISVIRIEIHKNKTSGFGECVPYKYAGENIDDLIKQMNLPDMELHFDVIDELDISPTLKNGLISAYFDWLAKTMHQPVWSLLGMEKPDNILTAYTLSLDSADKMVEQALAHSDKPLLKLKLGADGDSQRITEIRKARPEARIIVDANCGWNNDNINELLQCCADNGVEMVEQPLPPENDEILGTIKTDVCICADESFNNHNDIENLIGKYGAVNVKLDKTGGLINAIKACEMAHNNNLKIMVGCMMGSSLSMAPATIIAQNADWVDLDGSLWVVEDDDKKLEISNGAYIQTPTSNIWS